MTTPATKNITLKRGDSFDFFFRAKGRNSSGDLVYLDLTGVTVQSQIRSSQNDNLIVAFTCSITNQTTTPGGVLLRLEDTATSSLAPTSAAKWDVELKWPGVNGDRKTVLEGSVTITADTTHA